MSPPRDHDGKYIIQQNCLARLALARERMSSVLNGINVQSALCPPPEFPSVDLPLPEIPPQLIQHLCPCHLIQHLSSRHLIHHYLNSCHLIHHPRHLIHHIAGSCCIIANGVHFDTCRRLQYLLECCRQ